MAEKAFRKMTHNYEKFSMILGSNAIGIAQARTNGDLDRILNNQLKITRKVFQNPVLCHISSQRVHHTPFVANKIHYCGI